MKQLQFQVEFAIWWKKTGKLQVEVLPIIEANSINDVFKAMAERELEIPDDCEMIEYRVRRIGEA